jgi:cytosolic carboxypeptidase protein 2/3
MFRLSFELYTQYEQDEVQIAYCIPYTYTRLSEFLLQLSSRPETKPFLKISKLCTSLGGLEVPLVLVHQGLEEEGADVGEEGVARRCVVVSGRAHPGESNGSHMMEGFVEWLCGGSKEAAMLRRYVVFKIVPMLNPDGVAIGNYRTGLSGRDFNREYRSPDKALFPEVYHFKKLVA